MGLWIGAGVDAGEEPMPRMKAVFRNDSARPTNKRR